MQDIVHLRLASRGERLRAFLIDGAVIFFFQFAVIMALRFSGVLVIKDEQAYQAFIERFETLSGFVTLLYFPIFTAIWGATPGKKILKMKVVSNGGERISVGRVLLREVLGRWIGLGLLGHLWIFFNKRKKTAWDYIAGSIVVKA